MDGRIFWVEKKTRDSTALKQCLTKDLIFFSNLREILPIQAFEIHRKIPKNPSIHP